MAPIAIALAGLSACGGGGGGGGQPPVANQGCDATTCGTLLVSLTDPDSDFLSCFVDVASLSLTRANGTVVRALPTRQRVDFAELVDLTEFVTAATIPNA